MMGFGRSKRSPASGAAKSSEGAAGRSESVDPKTPRAPSDQGVGSVLVVGEALIDIVHRGDGSVDEHPGGSPANVALTLGRLGRSVELLTWIGEDAYGHVIRKWLSGSRVTLSPASTGASQTSLAIARLDESGAATYEFDIEWIVRKDVAAPADALLVHTGSIASVMQPGTDGVLDLLTRSRRQSTISYDPNIRPTLMGRPADVRDRIEQLVDLADVIKVSDEDLEWLYPTRSAAASAAAWHARTKGIVVLTRGSAGATAWTAQGTVEVSAPPVTVVDTVGAGDSFMGALIDGLWQAKLLGAEQRGALKDIDAGTMTRTLEQCVRVAAITVSRAGANPPRRAELDANPTGESSPDHASAPPAPPPEVR